MDVNSISNNINDLNQSSQLQTDKITQSNNIKKVDSEIASSLSINKYNKRDELTLNVQSLNDGIAISNIINKSLQEQQSYLQNIQTELENLKSEENTLKDKNDIKQSINENLQSFNKIAYETKYKNESLLSIDSLQEKKQININTENQDFSIDKINTPEFANEIYQTSSKADFNNTKQLDITLLKVKDSANEIENVSNKFMQLGEKLVEVAKEVIKEQVSLHNQNKDFGIESADFSKNNISANLGYLAASQANIVQAQSVRLLS